LSKPQEADIKEKKKLQSQVAWLSLAWFGLAWLGWLTLHNILGELPSCVFALVCVKVI
jgi:hypothetical protein